MFLLAAFLPLGSASVILSGFGGWCYCSDRGKHKNLQQGPKLTDWKAHSLISWRSLEHVWVNLGEKMCMHICAWPLLSNTNQLFPLSYLEFGMAVGVRVSVCACVARESMWVHTVWRCAGVKEKGWDCLVMRLLQITWQVWYSHYYSFFPQSHDCLLYNCPCLGAFQEHSHHRWTGQRSPLWLIS